MYEQLHKRNYYCCKQLKTLWQREKLLFMSIVSFCHNVFKSRLLQKRQKGNVCGEGLLFLEQHALLHLLFNMNRFFKSNQYFTFPKYARFYAHLKYKTFKNIVAKENIVHNKDFSFCHNVFDSIK